MIPVSRCCPHDSPEDWRREVHGDVDLGPFGPLIDLSTHGALWRPEGRRPITACQIAQDRPCFPERFFLPIAENGHGAIRVHGTELRRIQAAVAMPGVVPLVW